MSGDVMCMGPRTKNIFECYREERAKNIFSTTIKSYREERAKNIKSYREERAKTIFQPLKVIAYNESDSH